MKNFKVLFFTLCGVLCFGIVQAQWTNAGVNLWTFDNVGVNTAVPLYDLDVIGTARVTSRLELTATTDASGSPNTGVLEIANALRLDGNEIITNNNATLFLNHNNNGDVRIDNTTFTVDASTNRVGIGTTAPAYPLDVNGDVRVRGNDIFGNTGDFRLTAGSGGYIDLRPKDAAYGLILREYNSLDWGNVEVTANGLGLGYRTSGAHLMIGTTGNVGVGVNSPAFKLDVNGDIKVRGNDIYGNTSLVLRGASGGFVETKSNSATWGLVVREYNSNDYGNIEITSSGLGFGYNTSGANMTINSSGNVGIGTTAPGARLHVNGGAIQIGSYEEFSDEGFELMGVNSSVVPTRDCLDDLGVSSNRWRNVNICGSVITSSDRNLKSNIEDMEYGLEEIMEMRPVTYTYKERENEGTKLGLIAQELQPIVNEIVKSDELRGDESGNKVKEAREHLGVDYTALIPVLIKGMQEQQILIEEQQARIDQLEALVSDSATPSQEETAPQNDFRINAQPTGKVFQNNPNPFKNTTVINYELPENTTKAQLIVSDLLGTQVANYNLSSHQKSGQVTVQADSLAGGTYVYTLIVDGTPVASNKMIVTK